MAILDNFAYLISFKEIPIRIKDTNKYEINLILKITDDIFEKFFNNTDEFTCTVYSNYEISGLNFLKYIHGNVKKEHGFHRRSSYNFSHKTYIKADLINRNISYVSSPTNEVIGKLMLIQRKYFIAFMKSKGSKENYLLIMPLIKK